MKMKSKSYTDLLVWQAAHKLVLDIYQLTKHFPKEETFGLSAQIRRAGISIPAIIAEGFGRKGMKDKQRFYNIAHGSLNEVGYYLILINDLRYGDTTKLKTRLTEISRMLNSYSNSLPG